MAKERTFEVKDLVGTQLMPKRSITMAQFRAELDVAKAKAKRIAAENRRIMASR